MGWGLYVMCGLCAASFFLAVSMVTFEKKGQHIQTYLTKTIASICFVTAAFVAVYLKGKAGAVPLLLTGGLVLGMLGDIFLCRAQIAKEEYWDTLLTAGGVFFLTGHLCYFVAFLLLGGGRIPGLFVLVPLLMILIALLMHTGEWKIAPANRLNYIGYAMVSGLMLAAGIGLFLTEPFSGRAILSAASIVFLFSDLALGTYNFGRFHTTWMRYICILAYYIAQILFVFGIWLV